MTEIFGAGPAAPEPFVPPAVGDFEDKPQLRFGLSQEVGGRDVYVGPNPAYQGKTLVIDVKGPATFQDKQTGKEKTAVDTASIRVVETGEVFEDQRIFAAGIVRQIKGLAGKRIIASVGSYETAKQPGVKFVELTAPTAQQVEAANAALAGRSPSNDGTTPPF